jgi:hypothetical protein
MSIELVSHFKFCSCTLYSFSRQLVDQGESKIASLKLEAVSLRENLTKAQLEKEVAEQQLSNQSTRISILDRRSL